MALAHHLMVEGKDDWFVLKALLKGNGGEIRETGTRMVHDVRWRGIDRRIETTDYETEQGVSRLLDSLPVRIKQSGLERLAIVLDADEDVASRWERLRQTLDAAGYLPPTAPAVGGTICRGNDLPTVGVWIMPDNTLPGMLEDFVTLLIPPDDVLLPAVDEHLGNIPNCPTRFHDRHKAKARIHAWLAVQEMPGRPLGLAITVKYLRSDLPVAQGFVDWLANVLFL